MKRSLACVGVLTLIPALACSASQGPSDTHNSGTSGAGGTAGAHASGGTSGMATGGTGAAGSGTGGAGAAGGTNTGGSAGSSSAGTGGSSGAGGAAGGAATGFKCPDSPGTFMLPSAHAAHIAGTTPLDSFNMNAGFTTVEGPVWVGDSLYFSELLTGDIPAARIFKLAPGNQLAVAVTDSGSNGLAVDASGQLFAADHKHGAISQVTLPSGPVTPIVTGYPAAAGQTPVRFISPNDLAIRSDGTIYFSDPNYQNMQPMTPTQSATHLYRVTSPPARAVSVIADAPSMPNGVTLSPDEKTLYVTGTGGFKKFAVMADGSLGPASDFAANYTGDGMAVDCAGNVYVAGGSPAVQVYSPAGASLGMIQLDNGGTTTNVAFGGTDHKTLYITAQGNDGQRGVFSVASTIAGFPY